MSNVKTADGYDVSVPSATHTSPKPPSLFGSMTKIIKNVQKKYGIILIDFNYGRVSKTIS